MAAFLDDPSVAKNADKHPNVSSLKVQNEVAAKCAEVLDLPALDQTTPEDTWKLLRREVKEKLARMLPKR